MLNNIAAENIMNKNQRKLMANYKQIESCFNIKDDSSKYSSLVTASTNAQYPIQRWFHLKEAYSLDLLPTLLADWKIDPKSIHKVLDPFCGVGTSLLSVQMIAKSYDLDDLVAYGIERNPFLQFVAKTKVSWSQFMIKRFRNATKTVLANYENSPIQSKPLLTTINNKKVFKTNTLKRLLQIKKAIDKLKVFEKRLLLLGYASALEAVSGVRKDGRALRFVPDKQLISVKDALRTTWNKIGEDLEDAPKKFKPIQSEILLGDGRTLSLDSGNGPSFTGLDLIIYSPPYLNNIDYSEVYKIELWMCSFIDSYEQFRNLRHNTFRSHPSIKFKSPFLMEKDDRLIDVNETLLTLIASLPSDNDFKWRKDLFRGYFDDIYQSLDKQKESLNSGGWIFCIVGNSLHGSEKHPEKRVPIATDLVIALIAKSIGLEVKAVQVARHLRRRSPGNHFLRESIVVMRKTE